jgi:hypothetical protein
MSPALALAFAQLAQTLAALVERVGGTGPLWKRGRLEVLTHFEVSFALRALEREARTLIKALAREIAAALPAFRPRRRDPNAPPPKHGFANKNVPAIRFLDGPPAPRPPRPPPTEPAPYPGWGPRIISFEGQAPSFSPPPRAPFVTPLRLMLFPAKRGCAALDPCRPGIVSTLYEPLPELVEARALAERLEGVVQALAAPETLARRLALKLRRRAAAVAAEGKAAEPAAGQPVRPRDPPDPSDGPRPAEVDPSPRGGGDVLRSAHHRED